VIFKATILRGNDAMKTEPGQIIRNETPEQKEVRLKKEHEWRQILQEQLGELWLRFNAPKASGETLSQKKEVKLEKIRGSGGKAA
jgi:hypothetical protein